MHALQDIDYLKACIYEVKYKGLITNGYKLRI